MAVQFKVPDKGNLSDQQYFQVPGADGILTGYQYDSETNTLYAKESQIIIPALHGITHIAEDPVPNATTDTPGLMSEDDKAKLDAIINTRLGILGFSGAGFPDDGGFMQGDIILAAGSEFISLERIGNTIRFTVDSPIPLNCCEECAQIFFLQDESDLSSVRPASCNGTMPSISSYGEFKIYQLPENSIFDPGDPNRLLGAKGNYPSFIFKRYDDGVTASEAELDIVLKRNLDLTSHTGWSMTPGPIGIAECVWFMGKDSDGAQIRFDLEPKSTPGILGALLYKGHTLTRRTAIITNYSAQILSTNQYSVKYWDTENSTTIGDEFTATNLWRWENYENSEYASSNPKKKVLDATKSLLPLGTIVDIYEYEIQSQSSTNSGNTDSSAITRAYFNKEPELPASALWSLTGAVTFGDLTYEKDDTNPTADETLMTVASTTIPGQRLFERTVWGITGFEDRLLLSDDGLYAATEGYYNPSGVPINNMFVADVDPSIPGLRVWMMPQMLVGDVNGDGTVNETDLDLMADAFGKSSGDTGYDVDADLNVDGVVDVKDLAMMGLNYDVDVQTTHTKPVYLWHRANHKNFMLTAYLGQPDWYIDGAATDDDNLPDSHLYPPIDVLLRAPIDSFDDTYLKVIKRGTLSTSPFEGLPFIVVKGVHWRDLPINGTLRILTGAYRNSLWTYQYKTAFSQWDDDGVMLIGISENFPFDEDFPISTATAPLDNTVPANTTVAELMHGDYTSPCCRLEFSVNNTTSDQSVQLQIKSGILDMQLPYELNRDSTVLDDLVRGLRPGYVVSKVMTQDGFITDGIGADVESDPTGFRVYTGGELPADATIDGETEKWNELQLMFRDDQLWVWWNGQIIAPDISATTALQTPGNVTGLAANLTSGTPYFPLFSDLDYGKVGFRMWPGAIVRSVELRDQLDSFTEFTNGGLEIVSS